VSTVCCREEVPATCPSLVLTSPTECDVPNWAWSRNLDKEEALARQWYRATQKKLLFISNYMLRINILCNLLVPNTTLSYTIMYCHSIHSKTISQQMSSRKRSPLMVSTRTNPFTAALLHSERWHHPLYRTHQSRESHVNAGIWTLQSITINCRTAKVTASVLLYSVPRLQKLSPFYSVVKGPLFVLDFFKKNCMRGLCLYYDNVMNARVYRSWTSNMSQPTDTQL